MVTSPLSLLLLHLLLPPHSSMRASLKKSVAGLAAGGAYCTPRGMDDWPGFAASRSEKRGEAVEMILHLLAFDQHFYHAPDSPPSPPPPPKFEGEIKQRQFDPESLRKASKYFKKVAFSGHHPLRVLPSSLVGKGSFGLVYKAHIEGEKDKEVVFKIAIQNPEDLEKEGKILDALQAKGVKGVPHFYGFVPNPMKGEKESPSSKALVLDMVKGEPLWRVASKRTFTTDESRAVLRKLLKIVEDLFRAGYYHGDLHGGNVMYDPSSGEVTLIDFGQGGPMDGVKTGRVLKDLHRSIIALLNLSDRLILAEIERSPQLNEIISMIYGEKHKEDPLKALEELRTCAWMKSTLSEAELRRARPPPLVGLKAEDMSVGLGKSTFPPFQSLRNYDTKQKVIDGFSPIPSSLVNSGKWPDMVFLRRVVPSEQPEYLGLLERLMKRETPRPGLPAVFQEFPSASVSFDEKEFEVKTFACDPPSYNNLAMIFTEVRATASNGNGAIPLSQFLWFAEKMGEALQGLQEEGVTVKEATLADVSVFAHMEEDDFRKRMSLTSTSEFQLSMLKGVKGIENAEQGEKDLARVLGAFLLEVSKGERVKEDPVRALRSLKLSGPSAELLGALLQPDSGKRWSLQKAREEIRSLRSVHPLPEELPE